MFNGGGGALVRGGGGGGQEGEFSHSACVELCLAAGVPWRQEDTTWPQQVTAPRAAGEQRRAASLSAKGELRIFKSCFPARLLQGNRVRVRALC